MQKISAILVSLFLLMLIGCGGGHHFTPAPQEQPARIAVTVTPATAHLNGGETTQFAAHVTNATNSAVTWRVIGAGNISTSGLYTAPSPIGAETSATIVATSVQDGTKSGRAIVGFTAITVAVSPSNPSVGLTATQQFAAEVAATTNPAVTWSVSGTGCSGATCGTISPTGLYRAPWCLPTPATVTVTATSVVDPTKSASTVVTHLNNGPQIAGTYSFLFQGTDPNGMTQTAGNFVAADGRITNGLKDAVDTINVNQSITFTGTYSSSCYARGTMTLTDSLENTRTYTYSVNTAGDRARFIQMDASGERGSGLMARQQQAVAGRKGTIGGGGGDYAFGFAGGYGHGIPGRPTQHGSTPNIPVIDYERVGLIGQLSMVDSVISGTVDANYAGTTYANASVAGTYTFDQNTGRGTARIIALDPIFHTYNFTYYPVSTDEMFWLSVDAVIPAENAPAAKPAQLWIYSPELSGSARRQTGSFTPEAFNATSVLHLAGAEPNSENADVLVGIITPDGSGNISGGPMDENSDAVVSNYSAVTGTYTLDEGNAGRGEIHLDFGGGVVRDLTFYLVTPTSAFLMDGTGTDEGPDAAVGFIEPQVGGPFSAADFTGLYIIGTSGLATWYVPVVSGATIADGVSTIIGMGDESDIFGNYPGVEVLAGSYEMPESGRTTFGPLIFYMITLDKGVIFEASALQHQPSVVMIQK